MNAKKCKKIRKVVSGWREAKYDYPVLAAIQRIVEKPKNRWLAVQLVPNLPDEHSVPVYGPELGKDGKPTGRMVVVSRKPWETRLVDCGRALYRDLKRSFA